MAVRYRIGAKLGSGGFGEVFEASRVSDSGAIEGGYAQKKLLGQWLENASAIERFRREVRILDEMDHPNVMPVVGRNLSDSPPWFVMPRAESNLADLLEKATTVDVEWVCAVFAEILAAMAYAHQTGRVVHRDLKPANVLFVNEVPVVSDFGLGRRLDPKTVGLTQSNIGMGTMPYMAPEQFTDAKHVGPPADVFALGKILWEMLAGRPPVVGRPSLESIPDEFRSFVDRCTSEDPDDRFTTASDALAAFRLLVGDGADSYAGTDLEEVLREWESLPEGEDAAVVTEIVRILIARRDDEELYFRAVPRLDPLLVSQLLKNHPSEFDVVLRSYNRHIQGGLPFDYCDVVANFYRRVFREVDDLALKKLIMERLVELGPTHNRWHVGNVVAEMLASIRERSVAEAAADVLRRNAAHAQWLVRYAEHRSLQPVIKAALTESAATTP